MKRVILMATAAATISISLQIHTMHPIQPIIAKTAGHYAKLIAKKSISGSMTTLHWILAAGMPISIGIPAAITPLMEERIFKNSINANKQTTDFITSELQKTHITIDAVKIESFGSHIIPGYKYIAIPQQASDEITKALENQDNKTLDKWRRVLQYESRYIHNHGLIVTSIAALTLPFVTHKLTKTIHSILPYAKKEKSFALQQLIKIPTGLGKLIITMSALSSVVSYQRWCANNEVALAEMKQRQHKSIKEKGQRIISQSQKYE